MTIARTRDARVVAQERPLDFLREFVRHPDHGPCRVAGVASIEGAWFCRLERIAPLPGVLSVPLERISNLGLQPLTAAEAADLAKRWEKEQGAKSGASSSRRRGARKGQVALHTKRLATRLKQEREHGQ